MKDDAIIVIFESPSGKCGYVVRRYVGGIIDPSFDEHGEAVFAKYYDALYSVGDHMVPCPIPDYLIDAIYACRRK